MSCRSLVKQGLSLSLAEDEKDLRMNYGPSNLPKDISMLKENEGNEENEMPHSPNRK